MMNNVDSSERNLLQDWSARLERYLAGQVQAMSFLARYWFTMHLFCIKLKKKKKKSHESDHVIRLLPHACLYISSKKNYLQVNFTVDIRAIDDEARKSIVSEFSNQVYRKCEQRIVNCTIERKVRDYNLLFNFPYRYLYWINYMTFIISA